MLSYTFRVQVFTELRGSLLSRQLIVKHTSFTRDINKISLTKTVLFCLSAIASGSPKVDPEINVKISHLYVSFSVAAKSPTLSRCAAVSPLFSPN